MNKLLNVQEISDNAKMIFVNNSVKRALLFGSYAYGNPTEESDIDIVIDTEGKLSFLRVCGICEELKQVFNKKVDLFDIREIKQGSNTLEDILTKGVLLYEKKQ